MLRFDYCGGVNTESITTTTERGALFVTPRLIEEIVAASSNVIALDSNRIDELLEQFRQYAMRTGSSIYAWNPENGIQSLREAGVGVPRTNRLLDAMKHVTSSSHFGLFIFTGYQKEFRAPMPAQLKQYSKMREATERRIILIDHPPKLPDGLADVVYLISDLTVKRGRPRLRDGRWVI